jgi:hypothetical protein
MASQDWTTDVAELPEGGERYDLTLDRIGKKPVPRNKPDQRAIVVKAIIDNGEYTGKRVSTVFNFNEGGYRAFEDFERALGQKAGWSGDDLKDFVKPLKEAERTARFSAIVHVNEYENDSERGVKYMMDSFEAPDEGAELELRTKPTQFQR